MLLAEDDRVLADALTRSLQRAGHAVAAAFDGQSALHLLDTSRFDLLVLDHGLPLVSGALVLQWARRHQPTMPVLLISALDDAEGRVRQSGVEPDEFLPKPFGLDEFDACIARTLAAVSMR